MAGVLNYLKPSALMPDRYAESPRDIDLDGLARDGYRGVILDLDQTLTPYHENTVDTGLREWYDEVVERFDVCVLSNHAGLDAPERGAALEDDMGVPVARFEQKKPSRHAFFTALGEIDAAVDETVVIGDLPFTDIVGANRYGFDTIQVTPIDGSDPWPLRAFRSAGLLLQRAYRRLGYEK